MTVRDKVGRPAMASRIAPDRDGPTSVVKLGLLVALALGLVYALTSAGRLVSLDGGVMYDTATRIVDQHTLALLPHHHGMPGVGGGYYSKYGIAQSVAEIPLYTVGQALAAHIADPLGHKIAIALTLLTNSVITALAVLLFFLLAYELGARRRDATVAALLIGLASPYWPYAKTDFSEPLSALALTGAVLYLVRARSRAGTAPYVVSGLFMAVALLTKLTALFALPALGLYALYIALDMAPRRGPRLVHNRQAPLGARASRPSPAFASQGPGTGETPALPDSAPRRWMVRQRSVGSAELMGALPRLVAWGAPIAAGLAAAAAYNLARYGRLTDTGYRSPEDLPFHAPLLTGLEGLLVSLGKGLLWYCPLVVLALALWPLLMRRRRAEGLLALGVIAPTLVVFATYPVWWGGHDWGPRYLLPLLPLVLLPLVFAPEVLARRAVARQLAVALVALSVAVQVLGVAVDGERFLQTGFNTPVQEQQTLWVAGDSPLLAHVWLLGYDAARVAAPRVAAGMLADYPWRHATGTSLSQRIAIDTPDFDYWWWQWLGRYGLNPPVEIAVALAGLFVLGIAMRRMAALCR